MKARTLTPYLIAGLTIQRLLEVRHARRNERWARENGAVEYGRGHYWTFFVLHPAWMLALLLEGRANRGRPSRGQVSGEVNWPMLALFLLLQPLRYWIIRTLGHYWNTRILILPGGGRVAGGPFRFVKHPNYAVVALEIASAPLAVGAWRTSLAFSLLNAALLLLVRIPAEEAALREYDQQGHDHQRRPD